jgi:hypothetical protein
MKKNTILLMLCLAASSLFIISCGNSSETDDSNDVEQQDDEAELEDSTNLISEAVYQCPMKCEGEKTYDKQGSCPVCEMDLKAVEEHVHDHGDDGHIH